MNKIKEALFEIEKNINIYCTDDISFRMLTRSDSFPMYEATKNILFNKNLAWGPPNSEKDVIKQIDLLLSEIKQNISITISIIEKKTGTWIGIMKYTIYKDSLIFTLWIHPNFWNNSKGSIIYGATSSFYLIFNETELSKIYAKHAIGYMQLEGLLKKYKFKYIYDESVYHENGSEIKCKTYELNKSNFNIGNILIKY